MLHHTISVTSWMYNFTILSLTYFFVFLTYSTHIYLYKEQHNVSVVWNIRNDFWSCIPLPPWTTVSESEELHVAISCLCTWLFSYMTWDKTCITSGLHCRSSSNCHKCIPLHLRKPLGRVTFLSAVIYFLSRAPGQRISCGYWRVLKEPIALPHASFETSQSYIVNN